MSTQYDARLREMDFDKPFGTVAHSEDHAEAQSIVMVFARVKYWAAKQMPRLEGQRPDDLDAAAELMVEAFAATWRAGYKPRDLLKAALQAVKRRE